MLDLEYEMTFTNWVEGDDDRLARSLVVARGRLTGRRQIGSATHRVA
jgi:hypothetical protein